MILVVNGGRRVARLELSPFLPGNLQPVEINHCTHAEQEVQTDDPLNWEAVIHGANLDLKAAKLHIPHCKSFQAPGEDELPATYTRDPMKLVRPLHLNV